MPVAGWRVESLLSDDAANACVVFEYHAVVRFADGSLGCPSTRPGDILRFIEDPKRPLEHGGDVVRNKAVLANHRVDGARETAVLPFRLTWAAAFGDDYLYSSNPRHSRRLTAARQHPFAFVRGLGLNPERIEDLAFCWDLDSAAEAAGLPLGVTPDDEVLQFLRTHLREPLPA